MCCVCFFFKQKTAYEMRISDWSSDVCSSDLVAARCAGVRRQQDHGPRPGDRGARASPAAEVRQRLGGLDRQSAGTQRLGASAGQSCAAEPQEEQRGRQLRFRPQRSEEHTSELQSLMRISYAVFCLKKKKKK